MTAKKVPGLIVEEVDGEYLVYDTDSNTVAALNISAAAVFEHCDGESQVADIVEVLSDSRTAIGPDEVTLALVELGDAGLITEAPEPEGVTRRALMARLGTGAAAAWTIPVVETIVAPTMAAAQSATPAPTTALPTTRMPTTRRPTTRRPTTASPTTRMPTTRRPTTRRPTTASPTTRMPTTRRPTTALPTPAPT